MTDHLECGQSDKLTEIASNINQLFDRSLPGWVRNLMIAAIASLFAMYGAIWLHMTTNYQTKSEARASRYEIREDLKTIDQKLDRLLETR